MAFRFWCFCFVTSSLSAWIRRLADQLGERTMKGASARVAGYLLGEIERGAGARFRLGQSKALVAQQLGMTGESFSRALRRFRDQGWIAVEGRRFEVLDPEALAAEAAGDSAADS